MARLGISSEARLVMQLPLTMFMRYRAHCGSFPE